MSKLPSKVYTDHAMMDEIIYNLKIIIGDLVIKNDTSANENETEESLHDSEILLDCKANVITLNYMPFTAGMLWDFYKEYFTELGLINTGDPALEPSEAMVLQQVRSDVAALIPANGTNPDFSVLDQDINYLIPLVDEEGNYILDEDGNYIYSKGIYKIEYSNELLEYCKQWYEKNYVEKNNYYRMLQGLPEYGADEHNVSYSKIYGIQPYKVCKEMGNGELLNKMDTFVRSGQLDVKQYIHEADSTTLNLYDTLGVYQYILDLYGSRKHYRYLNYLGAKKIDPYYARKAQNWDILYIPQVEPLVLHRFQEVYTINRDIYEKRTYQEAYKIYSTYYDELMMLLITSQTMADIIAEIPEWYIRRDVFDLRTCRYFLESQGVKFFKEIPLRYQIKIVKNLNTLIKYKSTNTSIEDIIAIFSNEDINVFKYYMFKKYDSSHSYFPSEILDENPYFTMNKRYDYGEEPVEFVDNIAIIPIDANSLLPTNMQIPTLSGVLADRPMTEQDQEYINDQAKPEDERQYYMDENGDIRVKPVPNRDGKTAKGEIAMVEDMFLADTSAPNSGSSSSVNEYHTDTLTVEVNRYMTSEDDEFIQDQSKPESERKYYQKSNGEIIDAKTFDIVYVKYTKDVVVFGTYITDTNGNPIIATDEDVSNAIEGIYLPDGSVITNSKILYKDAYIEIVDEETNTVTYGKTLFDPDTGDIWRDIDGNPMYELVSPNSYEFTMSQDDNYINNSTLFKTNDVGQFIDEDGNPVSESGKPPAVYSSMADMIADTTGTYTNNDGTIVPTPTFNNSFIGMLTGTDPTDEVIGQEPSTQQDYSALTSYNSNTPSPTKGEKKRNKIYNELGWDAPKYRPDSINCVCEGEGIDPNGMVYYINIEPIKDDEGEVISGTKTKSYDWETEYQHKIVYDFGEEFGNLDNIPSKEPFSFTIDRYGNAYEMEFVRTPINESYDNYIELNSYREDYDIVIQQDKYWDGLDKHNYVKSLHLKREETMENTKLMFINFSVDQKEFNKQMELFISLIFNKYANIDDVEIVVDKINPNTTFKLTNIFILLFCLSRAMTGNENIPFIDEIVRTYGNLPKPIGMEDKHDNKEYGNSTTEYDQRTDWMLLEFNDSVVDERNNTYEVYDGGYPEELIGTEYLMMDGGEEPVQYLEDPIVYDGSDLQVYERNNPRYYVNCANRITGFNFGINMEDIAMTLALPHSTFRFDHPSKSNYKYLGEPEYDKVYYENHWEDFDYKHYNLSDFGIDKFGIEQSIGKSKVETTDDLLAVFENNYKLYKSISDTMAMDCDNSDKVVILKYIYDSLFTVDYNESNESMYTYDTIKYKVEYETYSEEEVESAKIYIIFTEHYAINYELNERGELDKYYTEAQLIAKTWDEIEATDDPEILLALQYRILDKSGKATYPDPEEAYYIYTENVEAGDIKYDISPSGVKTPIVVYEKIWNGTEYVDDLDNPKLVLDDFGMPIPELDEYGNYSYIRKTAKKYEDLLRAKDYTLYSWYKNIVMQEDEEVKSDSIRETIDQIITTLQFYLNSENTKYIFSYVSTNSPQDIMQYIGLMINFFKSWKLQFLSSISSYNVDDKIETYAHINQDKIVEYKTSRWMNELAVNSDAIDTEVILSLSDYKGSGVKETLDIYGYHLVDIDDPLIYDGKHADYKNKDSGSIEDGVEYDVEMQTDIEGEEDILEGYADTEGNVLIVDGNRYIIPTMLAGMDPKFVSQFLDDFIDGNESSSVVVNGGYIGSNDQDEIYARPYKLVDGGNICARIDLSILDGGGPTSFSDTSFVAYLDGGDISKIDYSVLDPVTGEVPTYTIDGGQVSYFYMRGNYYDDETGQDEDFDYHYETVKFNIDNMQEAEETGFVISADLIVSSNQGNGIEIFDDGVYVSQTNTPEYLFDRFKQKVTNNKIEYDQLIANYKEDIYYYGDQEIQEQVIKDTYNNLFAIPFEILDLFLDTINDDLAVQPEEDTYTEYDGADVNGVPEGADFTMINGHTEPALSQAESQGEDIDNYNGGEELYMDFVEHNYKGSYYRNGYILKPNTTIIKDIAGEQTEAKTIELINWAKDLEILGWSYY